MRDHCSKFSLNSVKPNFNHQKKSGLKYQTPSQKGIKSVQFIVLHLYLFTLDKNSMLATFINKYCLISEV